MDKAVTSASGTRKKQIQADMEKMKERFARLLLGEDMSGGGKGVSSALALSNAIRNLAASVFGEQRRLEPMSAERKARWRKEISWLLSVTDHMVEFTPTQQKNKDGITMEVMTTRQRADLHTNIPALKKLDGILVDCLDSFKDQDEFYYVPRDTPEIAKREDDKWWLPTVKVPQEGLSEGCRKFLRNQRDFVNQVLKTMMAINEIVLSEMEIPESYVEALPKNGRACLGDLMYKSITVESFDPDEFLSTMDLSSEQKILDLKNRIEASKVIWTRKMSQKDGRSPWGSTVSLEKRELFEERAETILVYIKQRFPKIPQSTLDVSKIQHNRDVGHAVLESYSRTLGSLAHTVISRIEDVLYADEVTRSQAGAACKGNNIVREYEMEEEEEACSWGSPNSKTLFDVMGWELNQGRMEMKKGFLDDPIKDSEDKLMKKLTNIATNRKTSYLETLGVLRSPTARH